MGGFASSPGPSPSGVTAAPLPPLPDLNSSGGTGGGTDPASSGLLASLMSGIAPVKMGVDQILAAAKQIVQSGSVPGAEQVCGQIVALATSLLPMAAQAAMAPGMGGGGMAAAPPPPGGPQPILAPPQGGPPQGAM